MAEPGNISHPSPRTLCKADYHRRSVYESRQLLAFFFVQCERTYVLHANGTFIRPNIVGKPVRTTINTSGRVSNLNISRTHIQSRHRR